MSETLKIFIPMAGSGMHMRLHTWNKPRPLVSMAGKTSLGANCKIANSKIEESIVEADCELQDVVLCRSLIGIKARVQGRGDGQVSQLNVGDNSDILLS
jgi:hypothetical protein